MADEQLFAMAANAAPLCAAPEMKARVQGVVGREWVTVQEGNPDRDGLVKVRTEDGREGWVDGFLLIPVAAERACFERREGCWVFDAFVAGE